MTDAEIGAWQEAVGGSEGERGSGCIEARLVYDSARDPVPAGLRSSYRPSQVLYETEDYCLDLQLSTDQLRNDYKKKRLVLVGQVADRRRPDKPLSYLSVSVEGDNASQVSARSNELGEFVLEFDPSEYLCLKIPLEGGKRIELPLPRQVVAA